MQFEKKPRWVSAKTVAGIRECSVKTVWRHASEGIIPKPVKIGPRMTRWNLDELYAAMQGAAK